MNYTSYVTQDKDRWDSIANKMYGDPTLAPLILAVNGDVSILAELPGGITLKIPIRTDPLTGNDLPPWATDEDDTVENPDQTGPNIPVVPAPIVPLDFAPGYPVVVGNTIKFAILKSGTYPYSIEKVTGGVVASSPSYIFTAGFPVTTQEIVEGDNYIVKVGSIVSDPLTVTGTSQPLAFVVAPHFDSFLGTLYIRTEINKNGNYPTKITRVGDAVVVYNSNTTYTLGSSKSFQLENAETYDIIIGSLSARVVVGITEIMAVPPWIIKLALSYAYVSLDCTIYGQFTQDTEMSVERVDGNNTQGKTTGEVVWVSGGFIPGTTEHISTPYTELFRFNPIVPGAGGIEKGVEHILKIRREASRNEVFVFNFTAPLVDQGITEFDLESEGVGSCGRGPFISGPVSANATQLNFLLDANNVFRIKYRIKQLGDILRSGVVNMVNEIGTPIFTPPNVPVINYTELDPGTYQLEIEGDSCSSEVSTVTFIIMDESGEGPPVVTGPITPKIENKSLKTQADFTISGESGNWIINDISANSAPEGFNYYYMVDGRFYRRGSKLTNFHWPSDRSLFICKFQVRADFTGLNQLGQAGTDLIGGLDYSATSAFIQIHFNEY